MPKPQQLARSKPRADVAPEPVRTDRRRQWMLGLGAAVIVAAIVGYLAYRTAGDLPGEVFADLGNLHIDSETQPHTPYNSDPPTSGPHLPYIAPWGVHTEPISKELQVHNLEDGGVMVQYNCPSDCRDVVDKLRAIVSRYGEHAILAPFPGMQHRIALTAWTHLDAFDTFDERRIVRFIDSYRGIDHHKR